MSYQNRLKALREDHDLKQKDVAAILGVAQNTYSQYELGLRALPVEYLIVLCKFYHKSADYILGLTEDEST
jgi:transcriptional regulator with XRE-family HTH domain